MDGAMTLEGIMLPCRVMESMGVMVGDGVTLADGAMGVVEACETGGEMLLGGSMGWYGSMVIDEAVELGGMAIDEAVGPGGADMDIAAGLDDGMAINEATT